MPAKQKTGLAARQANAVEEDEESYLLVMGDERTGKEWRLDPDELGPDDDQICRQRTGIALDSCLQNPFGFGLVVLIWIARRHNGEPNLDYQNVRKHYPTYKSMNKLTFKVVDRQGNEVDVEDDGGNPLVDAV